MTNEEKAKELANYFVGEIDKESAAYAYHAAFAMAEWKDKQHTKEKQQWIENACEWLNKTINSDIDGYAPNYPFDKMINDFKQAMKGE